MIQYDAFNDTFIYAYQCFINLWWFFSRLSPCKSNMAKDVRLGLTQPHHFWWIEQIDGPNCLQLIPAAYILLYAASEAMWGAVRLRISLFRHCTKHLLWVGWMPTSSRNISQACLVLDCFPFFPDASRRNRLLHFQILYATFFRLCWSEKAAFCRASLGVSLRFRLDTVTMKTWIRND